MSNVTPDPADRPIEQNDAPDNIPSKERYMLWVRSAGRCAICNKVLYEDGFTGYELNLAEAAHIVGRSVAGPRGKSTLPASERNNVDNLMLLCLEHHTMIDKAKLQGNFPVEELHAMKAKHESRIRELTEMAEDQQTVILRMVGVVRGAPTGLSKEEAREAVIKSAKRYPHYTLRVEGDAEIDVRPLPDEGSAQYWATSVRKIALGVERLKDAIEEKQVRHLSIFAIGRIPLLAYLGHSLSDKVPHDIYQKHREADLGWKWANEGPQVDFEVIELQKGTARDKVALLVSVTGTVDPEGLPSEVDESYSIFTIEPRGITPHRDLMHQSKDLEAFSTAYKRFLAELERTHKGAKEILVFPAVPVSVAVVLGRDVMRDAQPALSIYDKSDSGYDFALRVNAKR